MWKGSRLVSAPTWLKGRFLFISNWFSTVRSRKIYILLCAILVIFLFWSATRYVHFRKYSHHRSVIQADHAEACLNTVLEQWSRATAEGDAILFHQPIQSKEMFYLPFTANGGIGISVGTGEEHVFLPDKDGLLTIKVPFSPIIIPKIHGITPREATLIHFKEGIIYKLWGYSAEKSCVTVQQKVFAHRVHSSLLVQEIVVSNRKMIPLHVTFKHIGANAWEGSSTKTASFEGNNGSQRTYYIHVKGSINNSPDLFTTGVTMALSRFPSEITVPMHSAKTLRQFTVIKPVYELPVNLPSPVPTQDPNSASESAKQELKKYLDKSDQIVALHIESWSRLWKAGIYINSNNDPDTPSSLQVNSTLYYVMSSLLLESDSTLTLHQVAEDNTTEENCYNGHPTMHLAVLWVLPQTELSVANLVSTWKSKLQQFQCSSYLKGAKGILQAIVLSFGGLEFIEKRLEFAANPASLQSNLTFRHVECYGSYLTIHVTTNHYTGNADQIYVHLDSHIDTSLYACGGGCQHNPVQLSADVSVFPVKLTSPVTPLLYIATNKTNLLELKQHIFSKNVQQVSPHLHNEYHKVGLPVKFWVSIALLIVGFHLYLAKLIYQECFRDLGKPKGAIS